MAKSENKQKNSTLSTNKAIYVNATDFKNHAAEYVMNVYRDEKTYIVTRFGKIYAELRPIQRSKSTDKDAVV